MYLSLCFEKNAQMNHIQQIAVNETNIFITTNISTININTPSYSTSFIHETAAIYDVNAQITFTSIKNIGVSSRKPTTTSYIYIQ